MNHNLPKPMFDALGREPSPTDHPSADVLTAFAENALMGDEYRRTADHLSRCGECREIVFLASSAADKPLQVEEEVAVVDAAPRRRMPRLVWGMSIAAGVLALASSLMWWRNQSARPQMEMASREVGIPPAQPVEPAQESQPAIESKSNTELKSPSELSIGSKSAIAFETSAKLAAPPPPVTKPPAKIAHHNDAAAKGAETLKMGSSAGIVAGAIPTPAQSRTSRAAATPSTVSIAGASPTLAPAVPHSNSFAAVQGGPVGEAPGSRNALVLNPQTPLRSVRATHPQWRITPDGHLEHSTFEGWSRVLADQSATFRVVSVIGNDVWVGGSGGALFHSDDEGQNWEQVALTPLSGRETATIVSIQFDDAQRGIVTMDSGKRCSTTDRGGNWSCQ